MNEEIRIHKGYAEWEEAKERGVAIPLMFGKYQHIFFSEKGKISLIQLKNFRYEGDLFWEIYCLEGNLFEDTERFDTKAEAVKRIGELLE